MKVKNNNRVYKGLTYYISDIKEGVVRVEIFKNINTELFWSIGMTFMNIYTELDIEDRVVPAVEQYIERFLINSLWTKIKGNLNG